MYYGSFFHISSVCFALALAVAVWAVLRRCPERVGKGVVLGLMMVNAFQHFFKCWVWPQHWGEGFTAVSSAYNVCALLIIASPLVMLWGGRALSNFIYVVGTVAGIGAICLPFWYIGMDVSELGWSYVRFYFCHAVLFLASVMPLALGWHRPSYKEFWQMGLVFLGALCVILLNDVVFIVMGLYPDTDVADLYGSLVKLNPFSIMGPSDNFPWIADVVKLFSPPVFMGENASGLYVPILWYAIPFYLGISVASFGVFAAMDHRQLSLDLRQRRAGKALAW